MVEQGMYLDAAFVLSEEGPWKAGFVQINGSGVHAIKAIREGKAVLGSYGGCFFEQLVIRVR